MSDVALKMDHVYKMFRKGEVFTSLRDLVPALTGKMFRRDELNMHDKREFWALQDLSFEVKRGEAFGIIGHNGAGKSTALKILSRIMKPTKGRIIVNGRLSALIEITAGFHQDLTGRENIFLHGAILGMSKLEIKSKLDQIIAFSGLEEFIDTPVKRYSSGMYARLGFSVAAHINPDVMIVDEVLSVGDWVFQAKCAERMKEIVRNGSAVLFVSHNLKSVAEFCHRCLLLDRGRTLMIGQTQEVISSYLKGQNFAQAKCTESRPVTISRAILRNQQGECIQFHAGEKVWIDVELRARVHCPKLSVSLYINNDESHAIFDTNTERLGYGNFSLDAGDVYFCTFEINLNLANGTFHPWISVYRYDTETEYDTRAPAATIYVSSDDDVRGYANCFPKVARQRLLTGSQSNVEAGGQAKK